MNSVLGGCCVNKACSRPCKVDVPIFSAVACKSAEEQMPGLGSGDGMEEWGRC